jgi:hypothetical protein
MLIAAPIDGRAEESDEVSEKGAQAIEIARSLPKLHGPRAGAVSNASSALTMTVVSYETALMVARSPIRLRRR